MSFSKGFKTSIIDSQLYVALMGALLASFFMLEEGTFRFPTFFLILITYFGGYIYTKYQNSGFFNRMLVVNAVAGIVCVILIIQNHNIDRLYKWVVIAILGLFYNSTFLDKTIRKVPLLKIFYVGLVWALVNSWLSFPSFNWPIFLISIFFITALVLPFDIRDMDEDDLLTFPRWIGIRNTKLLAYVLLILAAIGSYLYLSPIFAYAFIASCLISMLLVFFTSKNKPELYFSFIVESCSGLPLVFVILWRMVEIYL